MSNVSLLEETRGEVTSLLRDLIRINTSNPPGNEIEAAKFVGEHLDKEGFACEIYESKPGRGNVITRLAGAGGKPSLLLLSHLDVVPANPIEWRVDPFGGVIRDGFIWGRGALDMKSMTVIQVMIMKLLKRNGKKLKGDLVLAATAGEERGGEEGAGWLAKNHPEKIRADYVISELGGLAIPVDGRNLYTVQTSEKGILWLKIKAKGTSGHGSTPGSSDNAIVRMEKVVSRLGNYHSEIVLLPAVSEFFRKIADNCPEFRKAWIKLHHEPAKADEALDEFAQKNKFLAEEMRVKLRMTVTPTMIRGGVKENVIPSECEAVFDCRVLPGQTQKEAIETIRSLLKEVDLGKLEFEVIHFADPSNSPSKTPLYNEIVNVLKEYEPDCSVTPDMLTGGTDLRFLRKMGAVCYGFQPMHADEPYSVIKSGIHGVDERISIDNLVFGTSVLYNVIERFIT